MSQNTKIIPDTKQQMQHFIFGFFDYYGRFFDYRTYAISPHAGRPIRRDILEEGDRCFFYPEMSKYQIFCEKNSSGHWMDMNRPLIVQDFFELKRNMAILITPDTLANFRECCVYSHNFLYNGNYI